MRIAWIILVAGCGFRSQAGAVEDNAPDAAPNAAPDASFAHTCPENYNLSLPGFSGSSRYRLIIDGHPAWTQSDTCASDAPGATHLVVLETQNELNAVAALVNAPPLGIAGNSVWVGGVQQRTAALPGDNWLRFDDAPLTSGWSGAEPNDKDNGEVDHAEQFIKIEKDKPYLQDTAGTGNYGALCECDGKPIGPNATAAILSNLPPS